MLTAGNCYQLLVLRGKGEEWLLELSKSCRCSITIELAFYRELLPQGKNTAVPTPSPAGRNQQNKNHGFFTYSLPSSARAFWWLNPPERLTMWEPGRSPERIASELSSSLERNGKWTWGSNKECLAQVTRDNLTSLIFT